mmetsp:Transcript_65044/g.180378  ORF Transcript_65044/g.180378 Transcript_65044/m.180378 type:complete len:272 (+) Transcript_65044:201-1016(+)
MALACHAAALQLLGGFRVVGLVVTELVGAEAPLAQGALAEPLRPHAVFARVLADDLAREVLGAAELELIVVPRDLGGPHLDAREPVRHVLDHVLLLDDLPVEAGVQEHRGVGAAPQQVRVHRVEELVRHVVLDCQLRGPLVEVLVAPGKARWIPVASEHEVLDLDLRRQRAHQGDGLLDALDPVEVHRVVEALGVDPVAEAQAEVALVGAEAEGVVVVLLRVDVERDPVGRLGVEVLQVVVPRVLVGAGLAVLRPDLEPRLEVLHLLRRTL